MSDTTNDDDLHRQFHANIVDDIERHGRSIVCVYDCVDYPTEGFVPFAYTIGNVVAVATGDREARIPELLVIAPGAAAFSTTCRK